MFSLESVVSVGFGFGHMLVAAAADSGRQGNVPEFSVFRRAAHGVPSLAVSRDGRSAAIAT